MKLKIDNRATCEKLHNAFRAGNIVTGNDVKQVLIAHQWLHGNTGVLTVKNKKADAEGFRHQTVKLQYPNSRIEVAVAYINDDDFNNVWAINWYGPNNTLKLTLNGC